MATTTFKGHENNATTTLNTTINSSVTTVVLTAGGGAEFPSSGAFWITIFASGTEPDAGNEIMLVASRSTDTLTITTRGDQSTSAAGWTAGAHVHQLWTKEDISDITGAINGVESGSQTLTAVNTAGDITVGTDGSGNMITGTGNTTLAVFNTIATTVNAFGAATTLNVGNASGTTTLAGKLHVDVENDGVRFGPAPTVDAPNDADNLVITQQSGAGLGMSFISNGTEAITIAFGDSSDSNAGEFKYVNSNNRYTWSTVDNTIRMSLDATDLELVNVDLTVTAGDVDILAGELVVGANSSAQGTVTLWDGGGGNTPAYVLFHSPNGTAHYLFFEDDGTLKTHTSAPTANGDGNVIGAQT